MDKSDGEEFEEKVGTDVPPPKEPIVFVLYRIADDMEGVDLHYRIEVLNKKDLPREAIFLCNGVKFEEYCNPLYLAKEHIMKQKFKNAMNYTIKE